MTIAPSPSRRVLISGGGIAGLTLGILLKEHGWDRRSSSATTRRAPTAIGYVPPPMRMSLLRNAYRGAGWIAERLLADHAGTNPIFFDSTLQIVMPSWSKGRVALLGDAAACLTLLAGQGSHLAMAEAYVLATELGRHHDHAAAFAAYERVLKAPAANKQRQAVRFSKFFVPSERSVLPLRHVIERLSFNRFTSGLVFRFFGRSVLADYR